MLLVVLEAGKILISLAAHLASVGLLFLHADGARVGYRGDWIDDGEAAVVIFAELLVLVAVL